MVVGSDHETAVSVLEACNDNVQMAIGMHMDGTITSTQTEEEPPCDAGASVYQDR